LDVDRDEELSIIKELKNISAAAAEERSLQRWIEDALQAILGALERWSCGGLNQ